jgi:hypothetical protein
VKRAWLALFVSCLWSSVAVADLRPFTADSYRQLLSEHAGQPLLLVLWSVECPPCQQELATLGQLLKEVPTLPLTLIATDQGLPTSHLTAVLARHGLENVDAWVFADPVAARLRQAIDPEWYGELPRSYFFGADGERTTYSGRLPQAILQAWLGPR